MAALPIRRSARWSRSTRSFEQPGALARNRHEHGGSLLDDEQRHPFEYQRFEVAVDDVEFRV